jgi:hypothetical protein
MNEFGGAARGCLCEVPGFDKCRTESSRRSVHCDSKPSSSAADNEHVQLATQRTKFFAAVGHRRKLPLQEGTTSCSNSHFASEAQAACQSLFIPYIQVAAVKRSEEAAFYFGQPGQAGGGFFLDLKWQAR